MRDWQPDQLTTTGHIVWQQFIIQHPQLLDMACQAQPAARQPLEVVLPAAAGQLAGSCCGIKPTVHGHMGPSGPETPARCAALTL